MDGMKMILGEDDLTNINTQIEELRKDIKTIFQHLATLQKYAIFNLEEELEKESRDE